MHLLLFFMICHSKKSHRPRTSSRSCKQRGGIVCASRSLLVGRVPIHTFDHTQKSANSLCAVRAARLGWAAGGAAFLGRVDKRILR